MLLLVLDLLLVVMMVFELMGMSGSRRPSDQMLLRIHSHVLLLLLLLLL